MARIQSGRMSWIIATTVFGIAFAFSLAFAIFFGVHVAAAKQDLQKKDDELNRFASAAERKSPEFVAWFDKSAPGPRGPSVYSLLSDGTKYLAGRVNANPDEAIDAIKNDITAENIKADESLLQVIRKLNADHKADDGLITQLKAQTATEIARAEAAIKNLAAAATEYGSSVQALNAQIDSLKKDVQNYKDQTASGMTNIAQGFDAERAKFQQQIKTLQSQVDAKTQELADAKRKIEEIGNQVVHRGTAVDPSLLPKGHISSVFSDSRVVYIDRGRRDRVPLGLTFEVFDPILGISKDKDGELRGKATIEVNNVLDTISVCRVIRREPGKDLTPGDLLANAVYDPNMKFKFVIYGDFDIDDIGQTTATDRRRIETMITQWGGQLAPVPEGKLPQLDYSDDFLVLGQRPETPQAPRDAKDPTQVLQYNEALKRFNTYKDLEHEAQVLSIPVLNQNRFLVMIGYYKR